MKRIFYCTTLLCLITPLSWAMFCNTPQGTKGWIEQGMSEQDVTAACGAPSSATQIDKTNNRLNATQYWNYQQQTTSQLLPQGPGPTQYSSVKVSRSPNTLVAEINNNLISSLAINGEFVSSGSCPNGGFVSVGNNVDVLISRCGTAAQVTYQYEKDTSAQPPITQWTYQLPGGQSMNIQFEKGVVSELSQ